MHPAATVNFCVNIKEERQSAFYRNSPSYVKCVDEKILTSAHPKIELKTFSLIILKRFGVMALAMCHLVSGKLQISWQKKFQNIVYFFRV
jgi:fructose-1,6-bisphosphatase/inositol monophosphatase family enzyme